MLSPAPLNRGTQCITCWVNRATQNTGVCHSCVFVLQLHAASGEGHLIGQGEPETRVSGCTSRIVNLHPSCWKAAFYGLFINHRHCRPCHGANATNDTATTNSTTTTSTSFTTNKTGKQDHQLKRDAIYLNIAHSRPLQKRHDGGRAPKTRQHDSLDTYHASRITVIWHQLISFFTPMICSTRENLACVAVERKIFSYGTGYTLPTPRIVISYTSCTLHHVHSTRTIPNLPTPRIVIFQSIIHCPPPG